MSYRPLEAIRAKILALPTVAAAVSDRVYPTRAVDVPALNGGEKPIYPCVTFYWRTSPRAPWAPKVVDHGRVVIQVWVQDDLQSAFDLGDVIADGLHRQSFSSPGVCIKQCLQKNGPIHGWVAEESAWFVTHEFEVSASVAT